MKQKKILHLAKYFNPDVGGIEFVTQQIIEALKDKYDFTVIAFGKRNQIYLQQFSEYKVFRFAEVSKLFSQSLSLRYFFQSIIEIRQSSIVHLHYPNILALFSIIFNRNAKIIIHWHSDIMGKGFVGWITNKLTKILLKNVDCIVPTTRKYALSSSVISSYEHKIFPISIGIPDYFLCRNALIDSYVYSLYPQLKNKKIFLSIGRLVKFKGFEFIPRIAKAINSEDLLFVIVGDGPEYTNLVDGVNNLGLNDKFLFLTDIGPLDAYQSNIKSGLLDWFLRSSIALIFPSITRAESYGIVQLEALSYGLPIVGFNLQDSGTTYVNLDMETGFLVNLYNVSDMASKLLLLLDDTALRQELRENCRKRYLEHFTEELQINSFDALYSKMLSQ